jgi:hypothetical protein
MKKKFWTDCYSTAWHRCVAHDLPTNFLAKERDKQKAQVNPDGNLDNDNLSDANSI